jgi:hypothetical protein
MHVIVRKILVGYSGGKEYQPKGIDEKKEYRVVAMADRTRIRQFDGKDKEVVDVFFFVVNDDGRLVRLIDSNCSIRVIDE